MKTKEPAGSGATAPLHESHDESPFKDDAEGSMPQSSPPLTETEELAPAVDVKIIETALQKENITAAVIAKLKADYSNLKINGIDDRDGFKIVSEARKQCKAYRVVATKICKQGRASAIAIQQAWIAKEKEVTEAIKEIEQPLQVQEDAYYLELEQLSFKLQQLEKLPARKEKLLTLPEYGYKEENLAPLEEELLKMDDTAFDTFYNKKMSDHLAKKEAELKAQQEADAKAKIEADAKIKAEQDRITKEQKEKEEALRKERENMLDERFSARSTTLANLGMKWTGTAFVLEEMTVIKSVIETLDGDGWQSKLEELKPAIANVQKRLKEEQEDRDEKIRQEAAAKEKAESEAKILKMMVDGRVNQLLAIGLRKIDVPEGVYGYIYGDDANAWVSKEQVEELTTQEWDKLFEEIRVRVAEKKEALSLAIIKAKDMEKAAAQEKVEADAKAKEARQRELMPDIEKAEMFAKGLREIADMNLLSIKGTEVKEILHTAILQIRATADSITSQVESFKGKKKK